MGSRGGERDDLGGDVNRGITRAVIVGIVVFVWSSSELTEASVAVLEKLHH